MLNNVLRQRARNSWMLAFGDVITLLITFFILVLVLEVGYITKYQKWVSKQIDDSEKILAESFKESKLLTIKRTSFGIEVIIKNTKAFKEGGFEPSELLLIALQKLGKQLKTLPIILLKEEGFPSYVQKIMLKKHLHWEVGVHVAGYTDNGFVNPYSPLINNWFLSTMRAHRVMQVLSRNSELPHKLFAVAGYGEYRPIASNKTAEGRAKNRRVEISITAVLEHED